MGILFSSDDSSYCIRYMAGNDTWVAGEEVIDVKKFLCDPESIRTGWGKIQKGLSPVWFWNDKPQVWSSRPGKEAGIKSEEESTEFKMGFKVDMFSSSFGLRTWSSTGKGAREGFEALYVAILTGLDDNKGKVPVVEYTGSLAVNVGGYGATTRLPQFKIERWIETTEFDITDEILNAEPEVAADTDFDDDIPF